MRNLNWLPGELAAFNRHIALQDARIRELRDLRIFNHPEN